MRVLSLALGLGLVSASAQAQQPEVWTCSYPSFGDDASKLQITRFVISGNVMTDTGLTAGNQLAIVGNSEFTVSAAQPSWGGIHFVIIDRKSGAFRRGNASTMEALNNGRSGKCIKD